MKLRKGDKVMVLSGKDKGRTGTIVKVLPQLNKVVIDGINMIKRAHKPSQSRPKGGIIEEPAPLWVSKVAIIHPDKPKKTSRIGWQAGKKGEKVRVYTQAGKKEVKQHESVKK